MRKSDEIMSIRLSSIRVTEVRDTIEIQGKEALRGEVDGEENLETYWVLREDILMKTNLNDPTFSAKN